MFEFSCPAQILKVLSTILRLTEAKAEQGLQAKCSPVRQPNAL